MTEADALARARALLQEPQSRRAPLAALFAAGCLALLAAGALGVVLARPASAAESPAVP